MDGEKKREWMKREEKSGEEPRHIEERKEQTTENKKTHQTKAWTEENNGMMC